MLSQIGVNNCFVQHSHRFEIVRVSKFLYFRNGKSLRSSTYNMYFSLEKAFNQSEKKITTCGKNKSII